MLASPSRRKSPGRAARDEGVSEILGQVFVFGVLAAMAVLSLIAFGAAQRAVELRAVGLHASSAGARVAGVVVQAAVLAERQGTETTVTYRVELPQDFEQHSYVVELVPATATDPERIVVTVPAMGVSETSNLFAAGKPSSFAVCSSSVLGGPINVRFDTDPSNPAQSCLYLEVAT